jgi:signal peptidase
METSDRDQRSLSPAIQAAISFWQSEGKHHWIPVAGTSMFPLMQGGDRVLVALGHADIHVGDVIVFWQEGQLFVHRLIRIDRVATSITFLTKGDSAPKFDPPVKREEIIGRVLVIQRESRQMSLDTTAWRVLGWSIAMLSLGWAKLIGIGRSLRLGQRPRHLFKQVRRGSSRVFLRVLQATLRVVYRWRA